MPGISLLYTKSFSRTQIKDGFELHERQVIVWRHGPKFSVNFLHHIKRNSLDSEPADAKVTQFFPFIQRTHKKREEICTPTGVHSSSKCIICYLYIVSYSFIADKIKW